MTTIKTNNSTAINKEKETPKIPEDHHRETINRIKNLQTRKKSKKSLKAKNNSPSTIKTKKEKNSFVTAKKRKSSNTKKKVSMLIRPTTTLQLPSFESEVNLSTIDTLAETKLKPDIMLKPSQSNVEPSSFTTLTSIPSALSTIQSEKSQMFSQIPSIFLENNLLLSKQFSTASSQGSNTSNPNRGPISHPVTPNGSSGFSQSVFHTFSINSFKRALKSKPSNADSTKLNDKMGHLKSAGLTEEEIPVQVGHGHLKKMLRKKRQDKNPSFHKKGKYSKFKTGSANRK